MKHAIKAAWGFLASAKDQFASLQSIATILALALAAWWFNQQRELESKVTVQHLLSHRPLEENPREELVGLEIRVTNTGLTSVHLNPGVLIIGDVNPGVPTAPDVAPERHILLRDKTQDVSLEPGETDQCYFRTFVVPSFVKTIQLSTELRVPKENNYWNSSTLFDLGKIDAGKTQTITRTSP
jgi:hypothetical protein